MNNVRLNHLHQISSRLVRENQAICLEDHSVVKMMKGDQQKNIADACWGELVRQITHKGEWNEREVIGGVASNPHPLWVGYLKKQGEKWMRN